MAEEGKEYGNHEITNMLTDLKGRENKRQKGWQSNQINIF